MRMVLSLAFAALLASSTAFAQVTTIEASNPAPKGTGNPNQIVCEVEETTGTRLGARKVCKTKLEWQQLRNQHRETLEGVQRQATSTGPPQT